MSANCHPHRVHRPAAARRGAVKPTAPRRSASQSRRQAGNAPPRLWNEHRWLDGIRIRWPALIWVCRWQTFPWAWRRRTAFCGQKRAYLLLTSKAGLRLLTTAPCRSPAAAGQSWRMPMTRINDAINRRTALVHLTTATMLAAGAAKAQRPRLCWLRLKPPTLVANLYARGKARRQHPRGHRQRRHHHGGC